MFDGAIAKVFDAIKNSGVGQKASDMFSKMTDDEGLFQGGEDGRVFGRARDFREEKKKALDEYLEKREEKNKEKYGEGYASKFESALSHLGNDGYANLDLSEKRRLINRMQSPGYTGNFQQTLNEILGREN